MNLFHPSVFAEDLQMVDTLNTSSSSAAAMKCWRVVLDAHHLTGFLPLVQMRSNWDGEKFFGQVCLLPEMFTNSSNGVIVAPVCFGAKYWLALYIQYVFVSPFIHRDNSLEIVRSVEGSDAMRLDTLIGHRGLGKTYTRGSNREKKLAENSLESLIAAHGRGCRYVEFDVMLTKDFIPVILHESYLMVEARGPRAQLSTTSMLTAVEDECDPADFIAVPTHQLTLQQLQRTVKMVKTEDRQAPLRNLLVKHWPKILDLAAPCGSASSQETLTPKLIRRKSKTFRSKRCEATQRVITNEIATLKDLFERTPESLQLNLEVKFPFQPKNDSGLYLQTDHFDVNDYVDAILDVVFSYVASQPRRVIVFSSFDPDVCIALQLKQCRFHTIFLSDTEERLDQKDCRCIGISSAIQFASSNGLAGICIDSSTLLSDSDKITYSGNEAKKWTSKIQRMFLTSVPSLSEISASMEPRAVQRQGCTPDDWDMLSMEELQHWGRIKSGRARKIVDCAHAHALKVWTWGERNQDPYFAAFQVHVAGVDAVISDNVPVWSAEVGAGVAI
jgi:glycerophosphoryl diester phosphodiesterase